MDSSEQLRTAFQYQPTRVKDVALYTAYLEGNMVDDIPPNRSTFAVSDELLQTTMGG